MKLPPRVLLLSATTGYQLRSFNDAAARLGIELTFATDRCHTLDDPWQDAAVPVRFHDEDASLRLILDAAGPRPFAGVVAVGDRPTVLAARAAEALGLPGNPAEAVRLSSSKLGSRRCFAAAGLVTPWFLVVPDDGPPDAVARGGLRYPCVLKPTSLSGSRGVIRADDPEQCAAAIRRIRELLVRPDVRTLRHPDGRQIIVEGFVAGREYTVEGVLSNGRLQALAIFDKPDPLDGPFFEETIYVTPAALVEAEQRAIIDTVQQAVHALGLAHGAVHAECRLTGRDVVMLEAAPRPIGGLCSRVLRFAPPLPAPENGPISLEELLLRQAIGEDVTGWRRERVAAAVMMIPIPRRGHLKRVEGEEAARAVANVEEVRITAKRGQLLEPLPEAASYLGFIFARARLARDAEQAVRQAHRCLSFITDPAIGVSVAASHPSDPHPSDP